MGGKPVRLELGEIFVQDIQFGPETHIDKGVLYVNKEEALAAVGVDNRITEADLEIVRPGESVRILPIKDVIEPRVKLNGVKQFPGVINKVEQVGYGRTHVLRGTSVITVGRVVAVQEGVLDMSGPGAELSPYSRLVNLVLLVNCDEERERHEKEEIFRLAGLRLAEYVGKAGKNVEPDRIEVFELPPLLKRDPALDKLPKVVYIYMLISQGLLHDTYVYGVDVKKILPTFIHPNEILDGAVVSGNCVAACDKITTYQHQNNSVILELYKHHGKDLNFLGVIITNENVVLEDKIRSTDYTAKLAQLVGADGAIISEEGYGNPDTDLMLNCQKLERLGIKTVLITDECCGRDGSSQGLADAVPEANAIVSTGNVSELIELPPVERVIGYPESVEILAGGYKGSLRPDGSMTIEANAYLSCTSQIGFWKLRCVQF